MISLVRFFAASYGDTVMEYLYKGPYPTTILAHIQGNKSMNLFDMISAAQGGQALNNLGQQFGLNEQQSAEALRNLLPAFSTGLKRNTQTTDGLGALLNALNSGKHENYYDDGNIFSNTSTRDDGNNILGHMLGSPDVSRAVAERAAQQTGIGADILKAMLPYIASMVMGALFKQGQNPIGDILGQMMGGGQQQQAPQNNNPFGPLADILMKGGSPMPGNSPSSGADIFGSMFDADGDGSAMDDIFDAILGGRR